MIKTVAIKTDDFFIKSLNELKLDEKRKDLLHKIATYITNELKKCKTINLNFICTHNSRRSQLAQVWACYAAHFLKLNNIDSYSGGIAVTAFYRNTVKTLQEVGFNFQILEFSHQNPEYLISYENCTKPIIGFSKLYDDDHNKKPFIAITTCSKANEICLFIPDSIHRFHLLFEDPKNYDGTLYQAEKYKETNKQIAGEIHYIFNKVKNSL